MDSVECLESVLQSWRGTRWQAGQCCRGRVVDCRYFVIAVLDELCGIDKPLPARMPVYSPTHDRKAAFAMLREIRQRYPCKSVRGEPEPGDVVIVRPRHSHHRTLQHIMIMGAGGRAWHSSQGNGVGCTSLVAFAVARVFRMFGKEEWGRA
jgi:cell wall-associated NlpC family hydrolase